MNTCFETWGNLCGQVGFFQKDSGKCENDKSRCRKTVESKKVDSGKCKNTNPAVGKWRGGRNRTAENAKIQIPLSENGGEEEILTFFYEFANISISILGKRGSHYVWI